MKASRSDECPNIARTHIPLKTLEKDLRAKATVNLKAGNRDVAGQYALRLQTVTGQLVENRTQLEQAETTYKNLVKARDVAINAARTKIEMLKHSLDDLKVKRAMAELTEMASGMISEIGGSGDTARPIYDFQLSVERIAAAVEAARALPVPFVLTARAENFLHGIRDLDDTIKRLQAFKKAGAEVLYAPALGSLDNLRAVCGSVSRPVNALAGGSDFSVQQLAEAGAKRISLGSSLARIALSALMRAGEEIRDHGTFGFAKGGASYAEIDRLMRGKGA